MNEVSWAPPTCEYNWMGIEDFSGLDQGLIIIQYLEIIKGV
jgi:hypothetical protein